MTCKLRAELETASIALKEAVKRGLDSDITPCDMGELYNAYVSVKRTLKNLPEHSEQETSIPGIGNITFSDAGDYNLGLYQNDPLAGDLNFDTITTTDTLTGVVTVPEHEDDEKIVL